MKYPISKIYIDQDSQSDEITHTILQNYPETESRILSEKEQLPSMSISEGKRSLWLTHFKGHFLKSCPGTAESYRCCNYLVINETTNCPIDCSYCILQGYLNNPVITVYTNYQQIVEELSETSRLNPDRILRIGTGELTDSLALDPVTGLSARLINAVNALPNILLELKTKTNHVKHLLNEPPGRVVFSWSVNPEELVRSDERKSAPLEARLKAAGLAARKGFLVGLHFDPVIYTANWDETYNQLIRKISDHITGDHIAWISIGSFRYPPSLKTTIQQRFPRSHLFTGEQITGLDGKKRYIKPVRFTLYRELVALLKKYLGEVFIYFCMEDQELWKKILRKDPQNNLDVDWYFANHLSQKFPELNLPKPQKNVYETPVRFLKTGSSL